MDRNSSVNPTNLFKNNSYNLNNKRAGSKQYQLFPEVRTKLGEVIDSPYEASGSSLVFRTRQVKNDRNDFTTKFQSLRPRCGHDT